MNISPAEQPELLPNPTRLNPAHRSGERLKALLLLVAYGLGIASGFIIWGRTPPANAPSTAAAAVAAPIPPTPTATPSPLSQINMPDSYTLPVAFGNIGPQLVEAGGIDYDKFVQVYQQAGRPLSTDQLAVLTAGSDKPIEFTRDNAYFLLNFFWALGLTNKNGVLTAGPMIQYSQGNIGRFASTGGWTIGKKPSPELYSSASIIPLTAKQQARLEEVAGAVYRPCCNNPAAFPDCNHGMAMLGMLELMASQDATVAQMFEAAKYANAFWFPQQSLEIALFFLANKGTDFAAADSREFVGPYASSASGFQSVHQWLADNNLLEQTPSSGNSCGV